MRTVTATRLRHAAAGGRVAAGTCRGRRRRPLRLQVPWHGAGFHGAGPRGLLVAQAAMAHRPRSRPLRAARPRAARDPCKASLRSHRGPRAAQPGQLYRRRRRSSCRSGLARGDRSRCVPVPVAWATEPASAYANYLQARHGSGRRAEGRRPRGARVDAHHPRPQARQGNREGRPRLRPRASAHHRPRVRAQSGLDEPARHAVDAVDGAR